MVCCHIFVYLLCYFVCSCSSYNGSYCGGYFKAGVRVAMPDGHDALMSEYLTNLKITGYETIVSERCYNNVVASLCYGTLNICQNGSNETLPVCYNNCTDFSSLIERECPHYVKDGFSQMFSDSDLCGNVSNPLNCNDIIPGNDYCLYTVYMYIGGHITCCFIMSYCNSIIKRCNMNE